MWSEPDRAGADGRPIDVGTVFLTAPSFVGLELNSESNRRICPLSPVQCLKSSMDSRFEYVEQVGNLICGQSFQFINSLRSAGEPAAYLLRNGVFIARSA